MQEWTDTHEEVRVRIWRRAPDLIDFQVDPPAASLGSVRSITVTNIRCPPDFTDEEVAHRVVRLLDHIADHPESLFEQCNSVDDKLKAVRLLEVALQIKPYLEVAIKALPPERTEGAN